MAAAANKLKAWRHYRDKTVEELSNDSGVSPGQISDIENERGGYSPKSLHKLATALGIDVGTLLTVDPSEVGPFWRLWEMATPTQRDQLAEIAKTLIKPGQ